tara:strand:- start:303 stop:491 length:189 start_codon:yes stop_codon:yes gene_type:complete
MTKAERKALDDIIDYYLNVSDSINAVMTSYKDVGAREAIRLEAKSEIITDILTKLHKITNRV